MKDFVFKGERIALASFATSKYFRVWHHLNENQMEGEKQSSVHVIANRYQLDFVVLFTAIALLTSPRKGFYRSELQFTVRQLSEFRLNLHEIRGFRYHFTHHGEPQGIGVWVDSTPKSEGKFPQSGKKSARRSWIDLEIHFGYSFVGHYGRRFRRLRLLSRSYYLDSRWAQNPSQLVPYQLSK